MSASTPKPASHPLDGKLVIAVSSRALFDFEAENQMFESQGAEVYEKHQLENAQKAANPGVAFSLVSKLLRLNKPDSALVEVVLVSRNDPASGLRVFYSAQHHELPITRGAFVRSGNPYIYLKPFRASLFLSASEADVREALKIGVPAGRIIPARFAGDDPNSDQLRLAFDADAVLFDDSSERIFQEQGLAGFHQHEQEKRDFPHAPGPFKPFLDALNRLRSNFPSSDNRIRTALVTARNAPSHERAIRTLKSWGIDVDEAFFLGGLPKAEFLEQFRPDFFFDDQSRHCELAAPLVPTAHVPFGVMNELKDANSLPEVSVKDAEAGAEGAE